MAGALCCLARAGVLARAMGAWAEVLPLGLRFLALAGWRGLWPVTGFLGVVGVSGVAGVSDKAASCDKLPVGDSAPALAMTGAGAGARGVVAIGSAGLVGSVIGASGASGSGVAGSVASVKAGDA